jgi:hypothetical protein
MKQLTLFFIIFFITQLNANTIELTALRTQMKTETIKQFRARIQINKVQMKEAKKSERIQKSKSAMNRGGFKNTMKQNRGANARSALPIQKGKNANLSTQYEKIKNSPSTKVDQSSITPNTSSPGNGSFYRK